MSNRVTKSSSGAGGGGSAGSVISMTDTGDHQNFTLAQAPTTSNYFIELNNLLYAPDDPVFGFSIVSTTLTLNAPLTDPTVISGPKKLICV